MPSSLSCVAAFTQTQPPVELFLGKGVGPSSLGFIQVADEILLCLMGDTRSLSLRNSVPY